MKKLFASRLLITGIALAVYAYFCYSEYQAARKRPA